MYIAKLSSSSIRLFNTPTPILIGLEIRHIVLLACKIMIRSQDATLTVTLAHTIFQYSVIRERVTGLCLILTASYRGLVALPTRTRYYQIQMCKIRFKGGTRLQRGRHLGQRKKKMDLQLHIQLLASMKQISIEPALSLAQLSPCLFYRQIPRFCHTWVQLGIQSKLNCKLGHEVA